MIFFTDFGGERRGWSLGMDTGETKGKQNISSSLRGFRATAVQAALDGEKGERYLLLFPLVR